MNGFYKVTEKLYEILIEDHDVNTITKGQASDVDLNNSNIFPLVHITPIPSRFSPQVQVFVFDIVAVNQRETLKGPILNKFTYNDNMDDNLNAMWYVLYRLYVQLKKFGDEFDIINEPALEPVLIGNKNMLDGWAMQLEIEIPIEEVTAC